MVARNDSGFKAGFFGAGGPPPQWLEAKIALVLVLSGMHGYFSGCQRRFARDENKKSPRFYKIINELVHDHFRADHLPRGAEAILIQTFIILSQLPAIQRCFSIKAGKVPVWQAADGFNTIAQWHATRRSIA